MEILFRMIQAISVFLVIAVPMILSNADGAALFMNIIRDRKNMFERIAAIFSEKAFKIAERTLNILARGINQETPAPFPLTSDFTGW
jgi:two-component system, LytTR family, sensor kinase